MAHALELPKRSVNRGLVFRRERMPKTHFALGHVQARNAHAFDKLIDPAAYAYHQTRHDGTHQDDILRGRLLEGPQDVAV